MKFGPDISFFWGNFSGVKGTSIRTSECLWEHLFVCACGYFLWPADTYLIEWNR